MSDDAVRLTVAALSSVTVAAAFVPIASGVPAESVSTGESFTPFISSVSVSTVGIVIPSDTW